MSVQCPEGRWEMRGTEYFRDTKSEARNINEQIRYVCRAWRGGLRDEGPGGVEVGMRTSPVLLKNVTDTLWSQPNKVQPTSDS